MANVGGVKARITRKGIEYANSILHQNLSNDLRTLQLSDCSGEDKGAKWEINSIENLESGIEHSAISLAPDVNGLRWTVGGAFLGLQGQWKAKYRKKLIKLSDGGKVRVKVKGLRLQVAIKLGADGNGRPTISMANCDVHVDDVDVKFDGGAAFLYNLFRDFFGRSLRGKLRDRIYSLIEKFINTDGTRKLSIVKVSTKLDNRFDLDYGLTQAPTITPDYLETEHKGKICWRDNQSEASLSAKPLAAIENTDKMLYLELSEYIANCMGCLAHENNVIQYKTKVSKLSDEFRAAIMVFLTEGHVTKDPVLENVMEIQLTSTSAPSMTITKEAVTVDIKLKVDVVLDMMEENLFTLQVNTSLLIQPLIVDERITGKLIKPSFQAEVVEAAFDVNPVLANFLQGILSCFVTSKVNEILEKGADLPVTGGVKFINTDFQLLDGSFIVATDVQMV